MCHPAERILELAQDEDVNPIKELLETIDSKSVFCFDITTFGFACGPTASTVYVGIDFNPKQAENSTSDGK